MASQYRTADCRESDQNIGEPSMTLSKLVLCSQLTRCDLVIVYTQNRHCLKRTNTGFWRRELPLHKGICTHVSETKTDFRLSGEGLRWTEEKWKKKMITVSKRSARLVFQLDPSYRHVHLSTRYRRATGACTGCPAPTFTDSNGFRRRVLGRIDVQFSEVYPPSSTNFITCYWIFTRDLTNCRTTAPP